MIFGKPHYKEKLRASMYLRRLASTCGPLKLDIPDDYVPLLITALEQYYAYTRAVKREDTRYQQAADWFHRQRAADP
jgi:hypothetical protein